VTVPENPYPPPAISPIKAVVRKLNRTGKDATFFAGGYLPETLGNLHLDGVDPKPEREQRARALAGTYASKDYMIIQIDLTDESRIWAVWELNRSTRIVQWVGFTYAVKVYSCN